MPFPAHPTEEYVESWFPINDPFGLRRMILPLFEYDHIQKRLIGRGTAFRIDPFRTFLTAQHVFDHQLADIRWQNSQRHSLTGLLSPGFVLGAPQLPPNSFARVMHYFAFRQPKSDPLAELRGDHTLTINAFDCMRLIFDPEHAGLSQDKRFLPIDFHDWDLSVGSKVMAIGFPTLSVSDPSPPDKLATIGEEMYGAIGYITALLPHGRGTTYPWPTFQVNVRWPFGMSGGPVFNEAGHVVGLVSRGMELENSEDSYALWLHPRIRLDPWLPTLDMLNPGWIKCWAALRRDP